MSQKELTREKQQQSKKNARCCSSNSSSVMEMKSFWNYRFL